MTEKNAACQNFEALTLVLWPVTKIDAASKFQMDRLLSAARQHDRNTVAPMETDSATRELEELKSAAKRVLRASAQQQREMEPRADEYRQRIEKASNEPLPQKQHMVVDAEMADLEAETAALSAEIAATGETLSAGARAASRAAQVQRVVLMPTSAAELQDYFSAHGDLPANPSAALPDALVNQYIGTAAQSAGVARDGDVPETDDDKLRRLQAQRDHLMATRTVQQAAISSAARCVGALTEQNVLRTIMTHEQSADDLEAQMKTPVGPLPACSQGDNCLGRSLPGCGAVLKAWQNPEGFAAFLATGQLVSDDTVGAVPGMCVPDMLLAYSMAAQCASMRGPVATKINFPFSVVSGRPGGFRSDVLINTQTMPVSWPRLKPADFVASKSTISYTTIDPKTRQATRRTEPVIQVKFVSAVLFDHTVYSTGHDANTVISPLRDPVTVTLKAHEPELPYVLADEIRANASIALSKRTIDRLCVDFLATVRLARTAPADDASLRLEMAPCWRRAMDAIPESVRPQMGLADEWMPGTHAVLAAVMWRYGMVQQLLDHPELRGNFNVNAFDRCHLSLLKWCIKQWVALGRPPSDMDLFGADGMVVTADSMCAQLRVDKLYPFYADEKPYLSPSAQREVRVEVTHRRRESPMETVRRALFPAEVFAGDPLPRAQCRLVFDRLKTLWTADLATDAEAWLTQSADRPLPNRLRTWVAEAGRAIALHENFDLSVWLLGLALEQWPWLWRAFAPPTALFPMADRDALDYLTGACPRRQPHLDDPAIAALHIKTAQQDDRERADLPEWFGILRGPLRYRTALGRSMVPHAMVNAGAEWAHAGQYVVTAALWLRIRVLTDTVRDFDARLGEDFATARAARAKEAERAAAPIEHPNQELVADIRAVVNDRAPRAGDYDNEDADPVVAMAQELVGVWKDPVAVKRVVSRDITLLDDIVDTLLPPAEQMLNEPPVPADAPFMGPPLDSPRDLAYAMRCALFEHLEMALVASQAPCADDAFWYGADPTSQGLTRLQAIKPVPGNVVCEDTIASLSGYVGEMDLLRDSEVTDHGTATEVRRSWVMQVATVMQLACYIRDFSDKHASNCKNSEYASWCAQTVLASALGTLRHCCRTPPFNVGLRWYRELRPGDTHVKARLQRQAQFLCDNRYSVLIAAREKLMGDILHNLPQQRMLSACWSNFAYVQQCWVPEQGELFRAAVAKASSFGSSERAMRELVRVEEEKADAEKQGNAAPAGGPPAQHQMCSDLPRVFRHLPAEWSTILLRLFQQIEATRQTHAVIYSRGAAHALPNIVNLINPETKHQMVDYMSRTDPTEPIRLQWFADLGVSPRGLAALVMTNVLYASHARVALIEETLASMGRVDFMFAWTALHVMILHRDTVHLPLPMHVARRQYLAAQVRANDLQNPPPPSFTTMRLCHPLGCAGVPTYFVPFETPGFYGAREDMFSLDHGQMVCTYRRGTAVFSRLSRRSRESAVSSMSSAASATFAAISCAKDDDYRRVLEGDLAQQINRLDASERKNVNATIAVMMTRPCNERPMRVFPVVGAFVWQRNRIPPREGPRAYTLCTGCGTLTIWSRDRHGGNGFLCGACDRLVRTATEGLWCFGCTACQPCEVIDLPRLTGEAQAAARAARSERRPQGSSIQAPTLRAQQARERTANNAKRQALMTETTVADEAARDAGDPEADVSDVLDRPLAATVTVTEKERLDKRARRPVTPRRQNIADSERLGASAVMLHRTAVKTRISRFQPRVLYDDRMQLGAFCTMRVHMCQPCENLIRGRDVLSAARISEQVNAEPTYVYIHGRRVSLVGGAEAQGPQRRYWPKAQK